MNFIFYTFRVTIGTYTVLNRSNWTGISTGFNMELVVTSMKTCKNVSMANISKMIHGYLFLQQQQQQQKYSRHNTKSSQVVNFEVKLNTNPNLVVQIEEHYLCLKCIFFILLSLLGGLSVLFYLDIVDHSYFKTACFQ